MAKRKEKQRWADSPAGLAAYETAKAQAQALADADGIDRGIEANEIFKQWTIRMLPQPQHSFGFERTIERVSCTNLERARAAGYGR